MPMSAIKLYMNRLTKQRARMRLMLSEAASVPHMTEQGHLDWKNDINGLLNDGRKITKSAAPADLENIGISVRLRR